MELNSNQSLLERNAYVALYDPHYTDLARYILYNNGTKEDAEDKQTVTT